MSFARAVLSESDVTSDESKEPGVLMKKTKGERREQKRRQKRKMRVHGARIRQLLQKKK
jgi:hypothetical protein